MDNTAAVTAAPENALPQKPVKARDYAFDTIKAMLIFLVVFGHVIVSCKGMHPALQVLYECIYTFHVPLFVFVSGFFAKKACNSRREALFGALPTFVIFALLFTVVRYLCFPGDRNAILAGWFNPPFAMWYLLCLFYWRFLAKDVSRLKGFALPVLFALGLGCGFINMAGQIFSLFRAFAFFPFFWLGIIFNANTVAAIRKIPKICGALIIALCIGGYCFARSLLVANPAVLEGILTRPTEAGIARALQTSLQMSYSYTDCGFVNPFVGMAVRGGAYLLAFLITVGFISLIPNRKSFLSHVGANTLCIYVGHTYIVSFLMRKMGLLDGVFTALGPWGSLALSLVLSVAITAFFSIPFWGKLFKFVTDGTTKGLKKLFGQTAKQ